MTNRAGSYFPKEVIIIIKFFTNLIKVLLSILGLVKFHYWDTFKEAGTG